MAVPIKWHGANKVLTAPKGREDSVLNLHVFNNGVVSVSVWELTPEEIVDIINRGHIYVMVIGGGSQPPMYVGNEASCRELAIDTGPIWKSYERVLKEKPE